MTTSLPQRNTTPDMTDANQNMSTGQSHCPQRRDATDSAKRDSITQARRALRMLSAAENKRKGVDPYPEYPHYDELKQIKAQLELKNN